MFNYMIGRIASVDENTLVLESGNVGFELTMSTHSIAELGCVGDTVKVYTYLNVREDGISLFGFAAKREKTLFLKLIGISGIGPKVAIAILSYGELNSLLSAIAAGNTSELGRIKGIGKKTAERIVLELKDKITRDFDIQGLETGIMPDTVTDRDAVEALTGLGYGKQEAVEAVRKVAKDGMTTEQIIMQALKG